MRSAAIVQYDDRADFSSFRTFAWTKGTPAPNPQVELYVVNAIEKELRARGLREAPPSDADILVASHLVGRIEASNVGNYLHNATWGVSVITSGVAAAGKGTLLVELVDVKSDQAVWHGSATGTVLENTLSVIEKKVNKMTRKIFKDFPPE